MKYVLFFLLILCVLSVNNVYGHKLISHDNSHTDIENALSQSNVVILSLPTPMTEANIPDYNSCQIF